MNDPSQHVVDPSVLPEEIVLELPDLGQDPLMPDKMDDHADDVQISFQLISALSPHLKSLIQKLVNGDEGSAFGVSSDGLAEYAKELLMLAVLTETDQQLNAIREGQEEILAYLVQKDKSELKGDLNFLTSILTDFKYNWSNSQYKRSHHTKVLDIRHSADQKIDFYREQVKKKLKKKVGWRADKDIKDQLQRVLQAFKNYQFALYMFAFSSFVDVLLLGNFEAGYLNGVAERIKRYIRDYQDLYHKSLERLEGYLMASIETSALKGLAGASQAAGKTIAKIPVIGEKQLNESLIEGGEKLKDMASERTIQSMQPFLEVGKDYSQPFVENVKMLKDLHSGEWDFFIDQENLYLRKKKKE
ncbi:MAG TPA: hypothetical protein PK646_03500 [Bacillota bacterium]|jgi:hypothetical protein|nr:hypothetical protein [Fastidiosipila sp.]HPX92593.1 hypothetical protein [Bacillota bacterium]HQB81139.1 hypothetical protein [Bacillota bacterium]